MSDSKELKSMRQMAWQRAKAELNSILCCFWDDSGEEFSVEMKKFIKVIEDNGYQE